MTITLSRLSLHASVLALALAATPIFSTPAAAQPAAACCAQPVQPTTLNLSAFGEVKRAPDMATLSAGVQSEGKTAALASGDNRARMARVFAALKAAGIADKDIQSSGLSLNPQWSYEQGKKPRILGYQAHNTVTVMVRDLAQVGAALDAIVDAGSNSINGVSFGLANPEAALDEARRAAAKALQGKANLYATSLGYRVGRLVTLNEGGSYDPRPQPMMMAKAVMMDGAEAAPTPVAPGEMTLRIDLNAVYELVR